MALDAPIEERPYLGMGGHQGSARAREEWLCPPKILVPLGKFDLDPCASVVRPWPTAIEHFTIHDDGLKLPWRGRVWLNPPYGAKTGHWLKRLVAHGNGIAMIFARTETDVWENCVWYRADAILFLHDRVTFCLTSGQPSRFNAGAPSALVAYGKDNVEALKRSKLNGMLVTDWEPVVK